VQTVTISDNTPSATIYYTTNGTTPTTSSSVYTGAISVSTTETLEGDCDGHGLLHQRCAIRRLHINLPVAATPTFSVAAEPTPRRRRDYLGYDYRRNHLLHHQWNHAHDSSTKYTGAISVSTTETLEAIATATGYATSAVANRRLHDQSTSRDANLQPWPPEPTPPCRR